MSEPTKHKRLSRADVDPPRKVQLEMPAMIFSVLIPGMTLPAVAHSTAPTAQLPADSCLLTVGAFLLQGIRPLCLYPVEPSCGVPSECRAECLRLQGASSRA